MSKQERDKLIVELVQNLRHGVFGSGEYVGFAANQAANIEKILTKLFDDRAS